MESILNVHSIHIRWKILIYAKRIKTVNNHCILIWTLKKKKKIIWENTLKYLKIKNVQFMFSNWHNIVHSSRILTIFMQIEYDNNEENYLMQPYDLF